MKKIMLNTPTNAVQFKKGYDEFINYCKVRNLTLATIKHYDDIINYCWYKFFDYNDDISTITEETIYSFILFCRNKGQKDITCNTNLRGVRAVLYYFMKLGYLNTFKIAEIKSDKELIETYTDAEIKLLLRKPDIKESTFVEYRNWVIINFLLATGCRASTLTNIKIPDLNFEEELIRYTHTKSRKQQVIPMSLVIKRTLSEYVKYLAPESYLFCNAYGTQLDTESLSHTLMYYNRLRGVSKTGVHRWRHTFAKKYIIQGGDIFRLQKILGHSSMDMVRNYVNMFTNDLKQDFNTFNPLDNMLSDKKHIEMKKRL